MSLKKIPRHKKGKPEKREIEKHGACRSCVFSYKRKPVVQKAKINSNIGNSEKKRQLIIMSGGKCSKCGYDKCQPALTFHHLDRKEKSFTISANLNLPMDVLEVEVKKCVLLCLNCHAEIDHGQQVV